MNNFYVSKAIIARASQRAHRPRIIDPACGTGGTIVDAFGLSNPPFRVPVMDATVRAYRATWGWLVIAALLAAGILALFLIP